MVFARTCTHLDRAGTPRLRKEIEQIASCLLTPVEPKDPTGWWVSELAKPTLTISLTSAPWTIHSLDLKQEMVQCRDMVPVESHWHLSFCLQLRALLNQEVLCMYVNFPTENYGALGAPFHHT